MVEIGYALSSEEHAPLELVRNAQRAEQVGFSFVSLSDHFHPWIDRQGQSPFAWCVVGGVAATTERLALGTGVTCPTTRTHPAIIAHSAATAAAMMPGRFFLGVGTGENLNEHVLGDRWPEQEVRLEQLSEAVDVIRLLFEGGVKSHHGKHYTVENARLYTLPPDPPPIIVAASGGRAAEQAGRIGNGIWSNGPSRSVVEAFEKAGGKGPRYGQLDVCWAEDETDARRTAREWWPNTSVPGELTQELASPSHIEQAAQLVTEDQVAQKVVCGPDPERHRQGIQEFVDAGFDHVYVHQVGPDQEGFFRFYEREVLPKLR